MSFNLQLPHINGELKSIDNVTSLVIIGANGSGKTRLSERLERGTPPTHTEQITIPLPHRLLAQKNIVFPKTIQIIPFEKSQNALMSGDPEIGSGDSFLKNNHRWQQQYFPNQLDDISEVMSALFSEHYFQSAEYRDNAKRKQHFSAPKTTNIEQLQLLWNKLFPHRQITANFENGNFDVSQPNPPSDHWYENRYDGSDLSDGERVAIYLIAQCLSVPKYTPLIIDEPEQHLHKAVISPFWDALEAERDDCLFVYLTHDLEFASSRKTATKIWMKGFNGVYWDWEEIKPNQSNGKDVPESEQLPEALILEIMGSRQPILLVEGQSGKYDHIIYQALYPDYHVIPMGGYEDVTKAVNVLREMKINRQWNVYGLIDRDFRDEEQVKELEGNGIFCTEVTEVENLLCVPEIIELMAEQLSENPENVLAMAQEFVLKELEDDLENQLSRKTIAQIEYVLTHKLDSRVKGKNEIHDKLHELFKNIDTNAIYDESEGQYRQIIANKDYVGALKVCKNKGILKRIGDKVFNYRGYQELILRILQKREPEFIDAIRKYLPTLP